jgi:putative peptide zinc metalloprotease protein
MNLTRVLDVALPDIPARSLAEQFPRLDPGITFREHIEDGKTVVRIYLPTTGFMFKFSTGEWQLAQLFDGVRSYEEIAEAYSQQTNIQYDLESVREFAAGLDSVDFWYKTPQERNILLMQQNTEDRRKKLKTRSKWADLSMVMFPAFNPDRFLTWLYSHTKFFYAPWFTGVTLIAFAITAGISVTHWREIGHDTVEFYNFTNMTWGTVFILYSLGMIVTAVHEFAHAHACKHYGGRVPAMGFALVFLTPAFYTDTTEGAVKGSRFQRLVIALSGIWSELILCSIATPIWWGTPPDTVIHDGAYFIMMLTGMMSVFINWNPLMKLDGYQMLCEIIGIPDLKEGSTAYVAAWVKKHIWRLPVEVPYVPKRRRPGFVLYALTSGIYSYVVLYFVAGFVGNFVRNFSPEWGFVPELGVALLIFRSRIHLLVNFMKFVYLDKKERVVAWFTPGRSLTTAIVAGLLLVLPLWHDSVSGRFILEPAQSAIIRARVPGTITELSIKEGQHVAAGESLAALRNFSLQSKWEESGANLALASAKMNSDGLHYSNYGLALKDHDRSAEEFQDLSAEESQLRIVSPISGTVLTPHPGDRLGGYLAEGSELVEIADVSKLRARIYISEYDFPKIETAAPARVQVNGIIGKWNTQTVAIAARTSELDPRLIEMDKLKGLNPPHFYQVDLYIQNSEGKLRPGMTGVARLYGRRRSLAAMGWEGFKNFWSRKVW